MNKDKLISLETQISLDKDIELEIDKREEERQRRVLIDGIDMDILKVTLTGGETIIHLETPLYSITTDKTYKLVEVE